MDTAPRHMRYLRCRSLAYFGHTTSGVRTSRFRRNPAASDAQSAPGFRTIGDVVLQARVSPILA
ncbi:MAG: hypothetical protein BMS9Abin17_0857 [Acidimicrobiia bacterium]|nr:MAG: hypothetical protein BMS9Abin17_0857 [Acidimicrobiia bacterium]